MNRIAFIIIAVSVAVSVPLMLVALYASEGGDYNGSMLSGTDRLAEISDVIPPEISESNNAFAMSMYRLIAAHPDNLDKNIFFSPFSMHMAFSLLYEGARGGTATEMESVFGFEPDAVTRHVHVASTMSYVNRDDQNATLSTANALWLRNDFEPSAGYVSIAGDPYLADVETLGFISDPVASAERINDWASNKTNDKIKEVVTKSDMEHPNLVLILNNAIYFNGMWNVPFSSVSDDWFWTDPSIDDPIMVDTMSLFSEFNYTESDGVRVLKLPYQGDRFSMLVFLPGGNLNVNHLEETISAENIDKWLLQMESTDVIVALPKFSIDNEYNLKNYLSTLGMPSVFEEQADLSGINSGLYVGFARQNAFIDVNEKGSEAAAVTTIGTLTVGEGGGPVRFSANQPFMFSIFDEESKTILFMGRISNPLQ